MSVTISCSLFIGIRVYPTDLYTKTRSSTAVCSKGHARPTTEAKFCAEDGGRFSFIEIQTPTPCMLKIARRYDWGDLSRITDWEQKVLDQVGWSKSPFLNVARRQGNGERTDLALGEKLDSISPSDREFDPVGFESSKYNVAAQRLISLRDELGLPSERPVELFLSLYYG